MPVVKNTVTGNNYLVKINTDGDICSSTAIRSYDKQLGSEGISGRTWFTLPFKYEPGSHTLWVFVNGLKVVVSQTPLNNREYREHSDEVVQFGAGVGENDILEFIVAGSYFGDGYGGSSGNGMTWILVGSNTTVQNNFGYMTDTRTTPISFTLPADPVEGETFAVVDAFGNFGTNSATLNRNGNKIAGLAQNYVFDEDGMASQFVFDGIDNWVIVNNISTDNGTPSPTGTPLPTSNFTWRYSNSGENPVDMNTGYLSDLRQWSIEYYLPTDPVEGDIVSFVDAFNGCTVGGHWLIIRAPQGFTITGATILQPPYSSFPNSNQYLIKNAGESVTLVFDGISNWVRIGSTSASTSTSTLPFETVYRSVYDLTQNVGEWREVMSLTITGFTPTKTAIIFARLELGSDIDTTAAGDVYVRLINKSFGNSVYDSTATNGHIDYSQNQSVVLNGWVSYYHSNNPASGSITVAVEVYAVDAGSRYYMNGGHDGAGTNPSNSYSSVIKAIMI